MTADILLKIYLVIHEILVVRIPRMSYKMEILAVFSFSGSFADLFQVKAVG